MFFYNIKLSDFEGSIENLIAQLQNNKYQWSDVQLIDIMKNYFIFLSQHHDFLQKHYLNYNLDLYGYLVQRKSYYLLQKYQPVDMNSDLETELSPEERFLELKELYSFKKVSKKLQELYHTASTQIVKAEETLEQSQDQQRASNITKILVPKKANVVLLTKSFNKLVKRLKMEVWRQNMYVSSSPFSTKDVTKKLQEILAQEENKAKEWNFIDFLEPFQFSFSVLIFAFVKLLEFINQSWIILHVDKNNILLRNNYHVIKK